MKFEKEKIIAQVDTRIADNNDDCLSNQIEAEIVKARKSYSIIHQENSKIIPYNFPLPNIICYPIYQPKHVQEIIDNISARKFRLVVFQEVIPNNVENNWVFSTGIRFIIECVLSEADIKWESSENKYSAKVFCPVESLHEVILDIFVDILMEGTLSNHHLFRSLYGTKALGLLINSYKKIEFIKLKTSLKLNYTDLNYFPFASIFKLHSSSNQIRYDIGKLYKFWQSYLLWLNDEIDEIPTIKNFEDIIKILPEKFKNQLNQISLINKYSQKCNQEGYYYFLWQRKSSNGQRAKTKRSLISVFGGTSLKGMTFVPFAFYHSVVPVRHLCYMLLFEKK